MSVQWVKDLQPANECKCRDVLIAVGDLGQLALKVASVRFKVVTWFHLDGEKVVVVSLSFPVRCVMGEESYGHLLQVVERMWRQGVEPI